MSGAKERVSLLRQKEQQLVDDYQAILRVAATETERQLAEQILRAQEFQIATLDLIEKDMVPEKFYSFGTITSPDVNVRSGPSPRHEKVRVAQSDMRVIVMEFEGNWAHVQLPDGQTGWIFKDYVRIDR